MVGSTIERGESATGSEDVTDHPLQGSKGRGGGIGLIALLLFFWAHLPVSHAAVGEQAPALEIAEWINGDGVTLKSLRGKVVIIEFFQLWCPGCNNFSIPLMEKWAGDFSDEIRNGALFQLSIHTVFEGHDFQNPDKLRTFVRKKGMDHLVGIDRHVGDDEVPVTMRRYRTLGTPAMAILDKSGVIRFQKFGGFDIDHAENLIRKLLQE